MPAPDPQPGVVVLAEDPLARSALRSALGDAEVIASAARVRDLPPGLDRVDVVVWDLGVHPDEALDHVQEALSLGAPVVALVTDEAAAREAQAAGALGVLPRDTEGALLVAAVHAVAAGLLVFDPSFPPAAAPAPPRPERDAAESLTPREREVLGLLVEGLSNKQIGDRLRISEHTAKFHVNAVLQKLGAQSRTEAVVRAARLGWVTL